METNKHHRRGKIVATVGPASSTPEALEELARAGVNVFRLNFSHGEHAEHKARRDAIREIEKKVGRPLGVLADMQGPKLRVGRFENGPVMLVPGAKFTLDSNPALGTQQRVNLPHPEIIKSVEIGSRLLLDDGKMVLKVLSKTPDSIETEVVVGGPLSERKGVNVPDVALPIPALTEKDRADLHFALSMGVDFIALSFVQKPEDVQEAKDIIKGRAWVVSKLEKPQAIQNLEAIVKLSDAIMIARGDLGVELPAEEVPVDQKKIISLCRQVGRPVIVATQMLESMITSPSPTRAEVSDVANAVYDGADATMLSAESAAGKYPKIAVETMAKVVSRVEQDPEWRRRMDAIRPAPVATATGALSLAAYEAASLLSADAIALADKTGKNTIDVARARPHAPVLAFGEPETARHLTVTWGVYPKIVEGLMASLDEGREFPAEVKETAKKDGLLTGDGALVLLNSPKGAKGEVTELRIIEA